MRWKAFIRQARARVPPAAPERTEHARMRQGAEEVEHSVYQCPLCAEAFLSMPRLKARVFRAHQFKNERR
eukprot:3068048-Lingulodinium_polyedra.AAC.1